MKQKERLELLTGEKMPEPTEQEYKKHNIPNSPFWHIEKNGQHNIVMGKYRINDEPFDTAQDLHEWMNKNQWNIMLSMIICTTNIIMNQNKQQ